ncbi:LysE/ArgO family amino acid transporter [Agaribacter flavus]|uniref:LysE/ArgO family amino acid transporter n=1 Tax=Agaribacter flavus TaxID=1902781 RepID=A0ABV7FK99_9ALTE
MQSFKQVIINHEFSALNNKIIHWIYTSTLPKLLTTKIISFEDMSVSFLSGASVGLSLIIAIGAQNIWVLSQSMAGANRLAIAGVCIVCDASLIVLGVFAANEIKLWLPSILPWFTWGGIVMLCYLAFSSLKRAIVGTSGLQLTDTTAAPWQQTAFTALAISLLNPHVYLDTVLLLGSIGAVQASPMLFAMGACLASLVWFSSLVLFSPKLKVLLSSPTRWRIFDTTIAILLSIVALQLYALT